VTGAFEPYGPTHLAAIGCGAIGAIGVVWLGRSVRGRSAEERVRRTFAVLLPVFSLPHQARQLAPGDFDLDSSLPLDVSDLAWLVAVWALWSRRSRATSLLYYWGLTLTLQAMLTPTLDNDFPDPDYFLFFITHLLTIWAALFLTFGLGIRPDWPGYWFAVACTAVWALCAITVNLLVDANYGYLSRKPDVATLLDLFGPWPAYLLAEGAVVMAGWALITWPWVVRRQRAVSG